jgi:transketolase
LILSRQNLPCLERSKDQIDAIRKGAYVLSDAGGTPDAIVIATGSEVEIALDAAKQLNAKGKKVRVVSMPSVDVFEAQDETYQESVLPAAVRARVAIEAGVTDYWRKYVGLDGKVVGIDRFGESAPGPKLYEYFGITADNVVKAVEEVL